jgi:hypothetical protein
MATYENKTVVSLVAGQDLSSNQYYFVEVASDGEVDPVSTAGNFAEGVLTNDPDAQGKAASVAIDGIVKVSCGGTVTRGGGVAADTNGQAVDATSGDAILGTALEAGSSGDIIRILLKYQGSA